MTAETSNARGEWVLVPREPSAGMLDSAENAMIESECAYNAGNQDARSDAHGFPTMRIWQAVVAYRAMLAAAPQPPAEAQAVAKLVNRKDADGGKTTTFIRPTSLGMDLPLGEYPLHLHPPPSAPVGVEDVVMAARNAENAIRNCAAAGQIGEGYVQYADDLRDAVQRLDQQPAAVDEAMVERAAAAVMSAPPGISVEAYVRIVLEAALAAQHQEPKS